MYKLALDGGVMRVADGASIPTDPGNADYQAYLAWVAEGHEAAAADEPDLWPAIRARRDRLLAESDWTQLSDAPLEAETQARWQVYRQALRDLPQTFSDPTSVIWPTLVLVLVALLWPGLAYAEAPITVITSTAQAADGFIFTAPEALVIAENSGQVLFDRDLGGGVSDFKRQGTVLTYFNHDLGRFDVLDQNYRVVDSWQAVGYPTDVHDLQLLPNGHALLLVYRVFPYDMSLVVPGGSPTATVMSCVIQELDQTKALVWQWDSWDYLPITGSDVDLTANLIDYAHCNAIEPDGEAVLLSNRHLSSVVKIDRASGAVVWQLGGALNEFTFVNDGGFERQHDIRRLADGRLTLFDNGGATRGFSRAVEYAIDEPGRVITRTWEYRGPWAFCCGNVQRLPGGNTFINWGPAHPTMTEVDRAGTVVFAADTTTGSYRSFKFPWWRPYYFPYVVR